MDTNTWGYFVVVTPGLQQLGPFKAQEAAELVADVLWEQIDPINIMVISQRHGTVTIRHQVGN